MDVRYKSRTNTLGNFLSYSFNHSIQVCT